MIKTFDEAFNELLKRHAKEVIEFSKTQGVYNILLKAAGALPESCDIVEYVMMNHLGLAIWLHHGATTPDIRKMLNILEIQYLPGFRLDTSTSGNWATGTATLHYINAHGQDARVQLFTSDCKTVETGRMIPEVKTTSCLEGLC